jgi:Ras family protein T1
MTTLQSYKTTLAYLAYLGYPHNDTTTALKVLTSNHEKASQRNVFLCYVFGAKGSGKVNFLASHLIKTSLMKGLIGRTFDEAYTPTTEEYSVVNSVQVRGVEKDFVVLISISSFFRCKNLGLNLTHWY